MPWRLQMADPTVQVRVGDVWPASHGDRSGYFVALPGGAYWHTLSFAFDLNTGQPTTQCWTVTLPDGDPLRMTVNPSINVQGGWHGWIKDGVISDDVSGRKYDADGRLREEDDGA